MDARFVRKLFNHNQKMPEAAFQLQLTYQAQLTL